MGNVLEMQPSSQEIYIFSSPGGTIIPAGKTPTLINILPVLLIVEHDALLQESQVALLCLYLHVILLLAHVEAVHILTKGEVVGRGFDAFAEHHLAEILYGTGLFAQLTEVKTGKDK